MPTNTKRSKKKKKTTAAKPRDKKRSAPTDGLALSADSVADVDTPLGKPATTKLERRATLDWALENRWATADISTIARIDRTTWHGWDMVRA